MARPENWGENWGELQSDAAGFIHQWAIFESTSSVRAQGIEP